MGALAATTPTRTGATSAGAAVAASDTINVSVMGPLGCILEIINGNASPDSMTISDDSVTPSGAAAAANAPSVANGTAKVFFISRKQAALATGNVTITHTVTSTVTYKLYPVG
ncbi:hypothetical protein [Asanoa siamensis]|uniref:Uncharacterized protein n=1 Tax=Asanoa siamensis TaxID=926357 RepID=A0ABQ4CKW1_9ACTN|nr:hypothetical protein [Asanoa siamensis]GIF71908.1 hypothetical protein Asi02nite_14260 [Asanoa siamensis]